VRGFKPSATLQAGGRRKETADEHFDQTDKPRLQGLATDSGRGPAVAAALEIRWHQKRKS